MIIAFTLMSDDMTIILSSVYIPSSTPGSMVQRWDHLRKITDNLQAPFSEIPLADDFYAKIGSDDYTLFLKLLGSANNKLLKPCLVWEKIQGHRNEGQVEAG